MKGIYNKVKRNISIFKLKLISIVFMVGFALYFYSPSQALSTSENFTVNQGSDSLKDDLVEESRRKYLLLDRRIIQQTENAVLKVGRVEKYAGNPLFVEDKEWENRYDNFYGNVIFDKEENLYKCWYSPFIIDTSAKGMTLEERNAEYSPPKGRRMGICYATSVDGIVWDKPNLNLVDYQGSSENNILWMGPHGAGIFKDEKASDPSTKYKAIFQGLSVGFSEDGIHWSDRIHIDGLKIPGDTHNNAFWAPNLNKYVGITRTFGDKGRQVTRIESDDFLHWDNEEVVMQGENANLQPYSMPVFYYAGLYIGLVAIHNQESDRVWTELAWSPDSKEWIRISPGSPLIPCSETALDYDYGCVYACANPVFLDNEIRLYYGGSDWKHFGWRNGCLAMATLRPDGFAGYQGLSDHSPSKITTIPLAYSGQSIQINADVEPGGWVNIGLYDGEKGDLLAEKRMTTTANNTTVDFGQDIDVDSIQLKFEFSQSKVYSFTFVE
ncbi:hypothetical protein [Membranihabitans marinus]|uniref:hypothetical protein n=1 Tax=Membranihabitans marinus TaxID=1227546 RepID=UPI001F47EF49|nr:hypothetical protein [Membranihabitans marinus]